jgi:hypothetical protein
LADQKVGTVNGADAVKFAIGAAIGYYFVAHMRKTGKAY